MRIFITGATGFVGSVLIKRLMLEDVRLGAAVLVGEDARHLPTMVERITVEPLSESSDYTKMLQDVDIVIHLAARVHIMEETASDPLQEFRKVNLSGTERLALQAAQAGVKRFVFMSTIGVNGDNSGDRSYNESDLPHPHNPYSVSKYEAELALGEISKQTAMEVVIIRAPIIYGPGNPGNFLSLLHIILRRVPLPLASVVNKRSMIYVGNLVDVLATCAVSPVAAGNTYLVSDDEDVSTPELIRRTAAALDVPDRLFPFPPSVMCLAAKLVGKSAVVNRLVGSLTIDNSKIRKELGWRPPFSMHEGLHATAEWFLRSLDSGR